MAAPWEVIAPTPDGRLAVVLVLLLLVAVAAATLGRLGVRREQVVAAARAVVQLALVSIVIAAALRSVGWSLAFALGMFLVATVTSSRRIDVSVRHGLLVGVAIAAGVVPVLVLVLGSGVIPLNGTGIVPTAGIVIGNTMTAATLTGRRAFAELSAHYGIYEAGLALGLSSTDAAYELIAPTAREALLPGLDQTRTVGLVTLPGAYIGVLLGGGTPVQAGAAQVVVLVGLLAAQALTAAVLLKFVSYGGVVRRDLLLRYPR